ncbi:DUF4294 domain-containing protein [Mucilaginibacter sp. UR6-1]|uniref:DUF4294 domain-containing protein n=1 Tax=Mucilaginibacter sp. UR6-1 TaxID=1435643 RepID=UPI001E5BEBEC|nr:DUF4294 domain-containing protein [Mucilaginibacter sp. UR6-1]MCC8408948.1 DUF4294 domain-containing protein [Mucilaginibacter sp. UR6-1]
MKFIGFILSSFCCCLPMLVAAQTDSAKPQMVIGKNDTIKTYLTENNGELMPWIVLPDIKIVDTRIFASEEDRLKYKRLRYNVMKVMPYARYAGERYRQLQRDLALTSDKKKQKELVKACEKQIKDLFNREIKNMTISQGEVLIKLIDRETGNSSYAMLKELKGGLNAFMMQSVARIFGHNLKQEYDPEVERDIEEVIRASGYDRAYY